MLVSGLAEAPGFATPQCSLALQPVRDYVDALVRKVCKEQQTCREHGYIMGRSRWSRAAAFETNWRQPAGRKSKIHDANLIELVRAQLLKNSAASSNLCIQTGTKDLIVSHTLHKQKAWIFADSEEIQGQMSASTMRRIVKAHLNEFKEPQCKSDYCQYCYDLDAKVIPKMVRLMNKGKAKLSELMPCYFAAWEVYEKKHSLHHRPGLHLELFLHFVNKHCSTSPCRDHVGSDFPCGLLHLRQPGSGFNQGQRVDLHSLEADLEFNLKKVQKLLNSYLFHRAANFHQRPALDALVVAPPLGHCVLMVDFKELLTLPIGNVQTSEMFYATGRFEVCTFGGVLVEHLPGSTAAAPRVETSHILLFSSVLDHTALRANQLIDVCLGLRKGHLPLEGLHIVADAGMHFRSYESLYHHMVTLPAKHRVPCWCHWGVEKHFKSACDRMFGWLNSWITRAKLNGANIKTLDELVSLVQSESSKQRSSDPASHIHVLRDESAKPPAGKRLLATDLHITRTYCIGATPADQKIYRYGVKVRNFVFSTQTVGTDLTSCLYDEDTESSGDYRRGYYGAGEAAWNTNPKTLARNEETTLTKRQQAQQHILDRNVMYLRHRAPLTEAQLQRKRADFEAKRQRRKERLAESSSSSSSSEEDSNAADISDSDGNWKRKSWVRLVHCGACSE